MKVMLPLALLTIGAAPVDYPRSYLLSIARISIEDTESIRAFAIETWGVQFKSICRIPKGWRIKAGSSATPDGVIEGDGSQGATWFNQGSPKELHAFVLVVLYTPVQRADIGAPDNGVPATFKGTATVNTADGEVKRALSYQNITLTPARRCPNS